MGSCWRSAKLTISVNFCRPPRSTSTGTLSPTLQPSRTSALGESEGPGRRRKEGISGVARWKEQGGRQRLPYWRDASWLAGGRPPTKQVCLGLDRLAIQGYNDVSQHQAAIPIPHDAQLYRQRNRIEIMFGRLKDWRRVATRYDRCPTVFFSAIALAATVIFWL